MEFISSDKSPNRPISFLFILALYSPFAILSTTSFISFVGVHMLLYRYLTNKAERSSIIPERMINRGKSSHSECSIEFLSIRKTIENGVSFMSLSILIDWKGAIIFAKPPDILIVYGAEKPFHFSVMRYPSLSTIYMAEGILPYVGRSERNAEVFIPISSDLSSFLVTKEIHLSFSEEKKESGRWYPVVVASIDWSIGLIEIPSFLFALYSLPPLMALIYSISSFSIKDSI